MFLTITFIIIIIIIIIIISVECVLLSVCKMIFSSHSLSRGRIIILTQDSSRLKGTAFWKYLYFLTSWRDSISKVLNPANYGKFQFDTLATKKQASVAIYFVALIF